MEIIIPFLGWKMAISETTNSLLSDLCLRGEALGGLRLMSIVIRTQCVAVRLADFAMVTLEIQKPFSEFMGSETIHLLKMLYNSEPRPVLKQGQ